jgi:hypothetical protein
MSGSRCEYGLICLPYLDGPALETLGCNAKASDVRFLWLLPITKEEVSYKKAYGLESLEDRFQQAKLNYLDPMRASVV